MSYLKYSIQIATIATKFLNKSQTMLNCINRLNHTCTQIALFFISSPRCLCWWEMLKLFFFLVFFFSHYICLISIIIVAPNGIWSKLELRNGFNIKLIKSTQDTERMISNYSIHISNVISNIYSNFVIIRFLYMACIWCGMKTILLVACPLGYTIWHSMVITVIVLIEDNVVL